ncbi:hypothetical protein SAMN05444350_14036 [Bacteroides stercorirosoris]|uniref:Uncharacterized protein n=2 Tax=Bacteroides stercorirosoris TaxID=871324 RepID=A0A1M6KSD3_9BACE|nr:hypothetical protein SAMN05444350_14036 [Bacteroides stercorirosoris]
MEHRMLLRKFLMKLKGASSYGLIDNLALTLNGNQLKAVNDAVPTSTCNNGFEFRDGAKVGTVHNFV